MACSKAEPSADNPNDAYPGDACPGSDVFIGTGSENGDVGEEIRPPARSGSESASNRLSPILPFFEGGVTHTQTVAAAAEAEDMQTKGKFKGTLSPCAHALVSMAHGVSCFFLIIGGNSPRLSTGEEVGSPHLPPTPQSSRGDGLSAPLFQDTKTTSFLQGRAGGQEKLVSPARPTLPP